MLTLGMDEVGRGCWAGPLVAGAVMLGRPIAGLRDSKKLSKKRRQALAAEIKIVAAGYGLGWVWPEEIDTLGLAAGVRLAFARALEAVAVDYDELIIDGNVNFFPENRRAKAVIKADDSVPAVSAASILAKVARDNYMAEIAREYPGYEFEKHVGYGTALHLEALRTLGVCRLHRKSYKPVRAFLVQ